MSADTPPQKRRYRKAQDYIGLKFYRLTVIRLTTESKHHSPVMECLCECGEAHFVTTEALNAGDTKSCGCLKREQLSLPTPLRIRIGRRRKYPSGRRNSQIKWSKNNPEKVAANAKRFRERHKNDVKVNKSDYYQRTKHRTTARNKARRNTDPIYKLESRLVTRIRSNLKGKRVDKSVIRLLGCTISQAHAHIQSLFTEGMTWDKFMRGEIHLDHKTPLRAFDLSIPEQRATAFHFTNLQPLWSVDNLRKSDNLPDGSRAREIPRNKPCRKPNVGHY